MSQMYHYTYGHKFEGIVEAGGLIPTTSVASEKPLLWFSPHKVFEPTAIKPRFSPTMGMIQPTFKQAAEEHVLLRFKLVDPAVELMDWSEACKYAGITGKVKKAMEKHGKSQKSQPANWFATPEALRLNQLIMEVFTEEGWVSK